MKMRIVKNLKIPKTKANQRFPPKQNQEMTGQLSEKHKNGETNLKFRFAQGIPKRITITRKISIL